jgi:hypothetical protein
LFGQVLPGVCEQCRESGTVLGRQVRVVVDDVQLVCRGDFHERAQSRRRRDVACPGEAISESGRWPRELRIQLLAIAASVEVNQLLGFGADRLSQ